MVATNYSSKYAAKTFENIKRFQGGNAIFNMPTMPIKCPGAPQKIMYLADDYWRKVGDGIQCMEHLYQDVLKSGRHLDQ